MSVQSPRARRIEQALGRVLRVALHPKIGHLVLCIKVLNLVVPVVGLKLAVRRRRHPLIMHIAHVAGLEGDALKAALHRGLGGLQLVLARLVQVALVLRARTARLAPSESLGRIGGAALLMRRRG